MGVSIGGWTAINLRRPHDPAASRPLTLFDPVLTFAPIPLRTMLVSAAMFSSRCTGTRCGAGSLRWIAGGADG